MSDFEKISAAREMIEKLANGIDPMTGKEVPESEVINQVRVSRCLFYVAGLLKEMEVPSAAAAVQAEAEAKPVRFRKMPFSLTAAQKESFVCSQTPITVSELTKRINDLIDPEMMYPLRYTSVLSWLQKIDALEAVEMPDGRKPRHPTAKGRGLGILLEERSFDEHTRLLVLYDWEAQNFILENMEAIAECQARLSLTKKDYRGDLWTVEQEFLLRELSGKGASAEEMAKTLKRSATAVRAQLVRMGLAEHRKDIL